MRQRLWDAVELAGLGLVAAAGFVVHLALGLALSGLALVYLSLSEGRSV